MTTACRPNGTWLKVPAIALVLLLTALVPARAQETSAQEALLIDASFNRVLFERNADEATAPSSMAKMMAHYLVFEALRDGRATIWTPVRVSRHAAGQPGSSIGIQAGEEIPFGVLLQASIVYSANDATVALAEHLGESEAEFARRMTERGRALGLQDSTFRNATGFTRPGQTVTARDLALLAVVLVNHHPDWYPLFSTPRFVFRGETYENRNPVLGRVEGADGVKTGQTRAGGYGLVATAARDGRRLVLVLNGLESAEARADEAARLLEWGFQQTAQSSNE